MSSRFPFLALPPELRHSVHHHYLSTNDGYFFNAQTKRLTGKDNQPIDLALLYTCRLVGQEMRGLALGLNVVTFSTSYSHDLWSRFAKFEVLLPRLFMKKSELLDEGFFFLDEATYDELCGRYPQFKRVLDCVKGRQAGFDFGDGINGWGESFTMGSRFVTETVQLMSRHDDFEQYVRDQYHGYMGSPREILALPSVPWILPDIQQLENMSRVLQCDCGYKSRWKFRTSAASAAIGFLSSLSPKVRCQLRRMIIREDKASAASPETHAQGLIEFCQENPALRIERRVSLWRAVWSRECYAYGRRPHKLRSRYITGPVGTWMAEALVLGPCGMPAGSYRLVFESHGAQDLCSRIFQDVVHRDAAWQAAIEILHSKEGDLAGLVQIRQTSSHICVGFPEAMEDIVRGESCVSCDFDVGRPWDVEKLMAEHADWNNSAAWIRNWYKGWETVWDLSGTGLGSFDELLNENMIE